MQGGPESLQALATGQIDISAAAFFGASAKLIASGMTIKAVVATYGSNAKVSSSVVTLEDSDVDSAEDLIGKKVAVNTLGANAEAVLDTYLKSEGLSQDEINEVTLVPLPALNSEAALREGQVDAAYMGLTALNAAQAQGGSRSSPPTSTSSVPTTVVASPDGQVHQGQPHHHQDAGRRRRQGQRLHATHTRDEVVDVIEKYHDEKGHPGSPRRSSTGRAPTAWPPRAESSRTPT